MERCATYSGENILFYGLHFAENMYECQQNMEETPLDNTIPKEVEGTVEGAASRETSL